MENQNNSWLRRIFQNYFIKFLQSTDQVFSLIIADPTTTTKASDDNVSTRIFLKFQYPYCLAFSMDRYISRDFYFDLLTNLSQKQSIWRILNFSILLCSSKVNRKIKKLSYHRLLSEAVATLGQMSCSFTILIKITGINTRFTVDTLNIFSTFKVLLSWIGNDILYF